MDSGGIQFIVNSSLPSSSSTPSWRYDVFISFRGEDTRRNITDHLYEALVGSGIHTFRDDDELPRGQEISSELLKSIEESRISIVVFSKNYGNSRWCLDELVKIMDCRRTIGQLVLPVFYHVDPSDVRKQKGAYEAAFVDHEKLYAANTQKVMTWRAALTEAANLSGWDLQNVAHGYEAKFIKKIVEVVSREVNHTFLHVAKHPVGLDYHEQELNWLLSTRTDDVLFLGIYGMGGIGKTTVAKYFYNSAFRNYEASCFLANVREEFGRPNDIVHLQKKLLSELLLMENVKIGNVDRGISMLRQRLGSKRVLIVLDDVDQPEQLNSLAGDQSWFGKGSLVMITTRNEHLLHQARVDKKYEVRELNHEKSIELFSWHAFKSPVPLQTYDALLEEMVKYAGGLPLALEVLGSSLVDKDIVQWKSMIKKLKVIPHHKIQEKLKLSFDTLDDYTQKEIFLDIACFFIGMEEKLAVMIFDGCGFHGVAGIGVLIDRCLLKVSPYGNTCTLQMHDLVRDMGRGIVHGDSPEMPGKRSRLWREVDVLDVLTNNKGTEEIKGIILDLQMQKRFSTRPFAGMPNLRLLKLKNVNLDGSFEGLFGGLRWLSWYDCPLEILPSDLHLQKLVCLDMQRSNLKTLWNGIKIMGNLKQMNLRRSVFFMSTPCFSEVPNLEILCLDGCKSLSNIDPSIGLLQKLIELGLQGCKNLKRLPSTITKLKSLEKLDVADCLDLEGLPEQLGDMKSLTFIDASESEIKELPDSIGLLDKLITLRLRGCYRLERLPSTITNLKSIKVLDVSECSDLEELPEQLGDIKGLTFIDASESGIKKLPDSIGLLDKLTTLSLGSCWNLKCLPSTITNLKSLKTLKFYECSDLEELPEHLGDMKWLTEIYVSGTGIKELPDSIGNMTSLKRLDISRTTIEKLPHSIGLLIHLEILLLDDCNLSDGHLPDNLQRLSSLKDLRLSGNNLCTLPSSIAQLSNLDRLDLSGNNLCTLPSSIAQLSNLRELKLNNCRSLHSVLDLPPNLTVLYADDCTSLEKLSVVSNFELREISLRYCSTLVEIQGLENVINSVWRILLQGCSSSFSTTTTEVFLLQEPHGDEVFTPHLYLSGGQDISNWFEYQGLMGDSAICFDVPLCVLDHSYHFFIWLDYDHWNFESDSIRILVTNKTRDSEWRNLFYRPDDDEYVAGSFVIHLPCNNEIKSGDSIEVSFETEDPNMKLGECGVHVADKSKKDFIKEREQLKRDFYVNEIETSCKRSRPSDNFKLSESISLTLISPHQTSTSVDPLALSPSNFGVGVDPLVVDPLNWGLDIVETSCNDTTKQLIGHHGELERGLDVNGAEISQPIRNRMELKRRFDHNEVETSCSDDRSQLIRNEDDPEGSLDVNGVEISYKKRRLSGMEHMQGGS